MAKDAPLAVEVPDAGRDSPGWIKVGVIAAVGFVLGIAWPRVMGVRLGISAPGESSSAASASAAHGGRAPEAAAAIAKGPAALAPESSSAPAVAVPATTSVVANAPSAAAAAPNITVQKGSVLSCKTADGDTKKGKACGSVAAIDQFIAPRVRKLSSCSGMEGLTGKLSLLVGADFDSNKFTYDVGKSSTVANQDAVAACLKSTFKGSSLSSTAHEHTRYTIAYPVTFSPSASGAASSGAGSAEERGAPDDKVERATDKVEKVTDSRGDEPKADRAELASGEAKVAWEVALVRSSPKTGELVTRLPRGTKVKVGSTKDGWFQIKFGDSFANDGWVYRGAIGR